MGNGPVKNYCIIKLPGILNRFPLITVTLLLVDTVIVTFNKHSPSTMGSIIIKSPAGKVDGGTIPLAQLAATSQLPLPTKR